MEKLNFPAQRRARLIASLGLAFDQHWWLEESFFGGDLSSQPSEKTMTKVDQVDFPELQNAFFMPSRLLYSLVSPCQALHEIPFASRSAKVCEALDLTSNPDNSYHSRGQLPKTSKFRLSQCTFRNSPFSEPDCGMEERRREPFCVKLCLRLVASQAKSSKGPQKEIKDDTVAYGDTMIAQIWRHLE